MKNKKWLSYTLGIVLTVIALTAVGIAGFRTGMMQNGVPFARMHNNPALAQNFDKNGQGTQGNNNPNNDGNGNNNPNNENHFGGTQNGRPENSRGNNFGNRENGGRRGGMPIVGGLFGLIHLAVLGALAWFGYKYVQKSGWRLVRVQAAPTPTEVSGAVVEEEKE